MIDVRIPSDNNFNFDECRCFYEINKCALKEDSDFWNIINNTFFYAFYSDNKLSLCVYFFEINNKLWVNAFGIRKNYLFNKECFKTALSWFDCDIWAKSVEKSAIFGLLATGFKRVKDDIFVFYKK